MRGVGGMYRLAGRRIRAALAILGLMGAVAGAQIDISETDLHDGEAVYGLLAPGTPIPHVNLESLALSAWGAIEPHPYTDVSFYAYGLFTDVNLVNGGAIVVTATGGTVDAGGLDTPARASVSAYGVRSTYGPIANSGPIDVTGLGGMAWSGGATTGLEDSSTSVRAYGIFAEDGPIDNAADVNVVATGGNMMGTAANTEHEVFAAAWAYGLYMDNDIAYMYTDRHVSNSGALTVTASGGDAQGSTDEANAAARAYGIEAFNAPAANSGPLTVSATGGNALSTSNGADEPEAYSGAFAYGIDSYHADVDNSGDIVASAIGGTASGQGAAKASAPALAAGIHISGNIMLEASESRNIGAITASAVGGAADSASADARADATAYALQASYADVNSIGNLTVTAQGGAASAYGIADVTADAYGALVASGGEMNVAGNIAATSIGGTADAHDRPNLHSDAVAHAYADASVHGLYVPSGYVYPNSVNNAGTITATAAGGTATAASVFDGEATSGVYALAQARAVVQGIYGGGEDVTNTGDIAIHGSGGTAEARIDGDIGGSGEIWADADGYARADGIETGGSVDNTGDIGVLAIGGTAEANAVSLATIRGSADAHGDAFGIHAGSRVTNAGSITVRAEGGTADAIGTDILADALGTAYGIYSSYGLITNSGQIDAVALGGVARSGATAIDIEGSDASARAYGVFSEDGAIDNTAQVNATAMGGTITGTAAGQGIAVGFATAETTGIHVVGSLSGIGDPEVEIQNTGAVTVRATGGEASSTLSGAYAYAIAQGFLTPYNDVDNTAAISVTAQGGTASATRYTDAWSTAYGMYVEGGRVNNSGNVMVTAMGGTATTTSSAPYTTLADASVYTRGIAAELMLNNTADVTVSMAGGTATSYSNAHANASGFGLRTFGTLGNSGDVLVTATGGTATSSHATATVDVTGLSSVAQNNTGTVTVIATGGTATGDGIADASVYAAGVGGSPLVNSGDVFVTATAGTTNGTDNRGDVFAVGITAGGDVQNSGNITVDATAAEGSTSQAYGIRMNSPGNLTNTGVIRVTGDTAYELSVASGTTTLVDTYNVTLDGDPDQASIGVADGATLALNDTTLTVTAISGATPWDTEYRLFATESTGVVDGNFADVRAVNPNTTATYYDQGTAGSVDDTVSLAYTPGGSSALAAAAVEKQAITQAADAVNHHMTTTLLQNILSPSPSGLLASAGSTAESLALAEAASDKSAGVFVEPYYSILDKDANPLGYDARLWGFSAGYERFVGNTLLALHAGYGQSDIDYSGAGYRGNSEEQDIVTAGFSGLTRRDPWLLRYGLTGFYGSHDYQGLTGLALDEGETADYDSYGLAATLMAGRIFRWGSHMLLPEAGLNWLWAHRQRYTTEATDPAWNTTYSAMDDHDLQAAAALQWLSSFVRDEVRVTPSASIGIRHLLTDAEAGAWQSIPGAAPVLVKSEQDRTAMTLSGSVTLTRIRHALSLAYDGEYSPDTERHNLWLRYSWLF